MNIPPFIDSIENLKTLCDFLSDFEAIAVDTEFVWQKTYFPQLGIIQIAVSEEHAFIIDTVAITDPSPLRDIMEDPKIVKIFHDAQQDITIINRYIDGVVINIFDTQRSAGFTGRSRTLSLEKLVYTIASVQLAKSETRTNWLKRPLDPKQIEYALDDVRYLPKVRLQLLDDADKRNNRDFILEEMGIYDNIVPFDFTDALERQFRKICGRIPGRFRNRAYRLVLWQEKTAREEDIPREHDIKKELISQLAMSDISTKEDLLKSNILNPKVQSRYGEVILTSLSGSEEPSKELQKSLRRPASDSNETVSLITIFQSFVHSLARERGIDPTLIFNKSEISSLVRKFSKKRTFPEVPGWRGKLIGEISELFLTGKTHITAVALPENGESENKK